MRHSAGHRAHGAVAMPADEQSSPIDVLLVMDWHAVVLTSETNAGEEEREVDCWPLGGPRARGVVELACGGSVRHMRRR